MKAQLEFVLQPIDSCFTLNFIDEKHFISPWHFHSEVEIVLITEGCGTRYIGDRWMSFSPGDICIIGSKTPHVFISDPEYYDPRSELVSKSICIQFNKEFCGTQLNSLPEFTHIEKLIQSSSRGIEFTAQTRQILKNKIIDLSKATGFQRMIRLLDVLDIMALSTHQKILSSPNYYNAEVNNKENGRMKVLLDYTNRNFSRKITTAEIALVLNLSKNSVCRYFKSKTNKVFSRFISEIRIGHACKLLIENEMNISQICYESGFNNISNFNRQFYQIKAMTPSEFRKKYNKQTHINPDFS